MPILNKTKKAVKPVVNEEETGVDLKKELEAIKKELKQLRKDFDELIAELNSEESSEETEDEEEEEAPKKGKSKASKDGEEEEETEEEVDFPTADEKEEETEEEVDFPTADEINAADKAQLKKWQKELFDETDQDKDLKYIKAKLLEECSDEAGSEDEEEEEEKPAASKKGKKAPVEEDEDEEEEPAPSKAKKNAFGFKFDADGCVTNVKEKNHLDCKTDADKAVKLANTYACIAQEAACKCAKGDSKSIAKCWAEWLADPENKETILKEKKEKAKKK